MNGIYLACCKARHANYNIVYQDIEKDKYKADLGGDMLNIDLSGYDFIIATPPCNWWSKANPYYKKSKYALETKHLLPDIIEKLGKQTKPFIIENVINKKRMKENNIFDIANKYNLYIIFHGRHTYFTNFYVDFENVPQQQDFKYGGKRVNNDGYNQGGLNVYLVIEAWLNEVTKNAKTI